MGTIDNTIQELRLVEKEYQIAYVLTKSGANCKELLNILQTGSHKVPGGIKVKKTENVHTKTWVKPAENTNIDDQFTVGNSLRANNLKSSFKNFIPPLQTPPHPMTRTSRGQWRPNQLLRPLSRNLLFLPSTVNFYVKRCPIPIRSPNISHIYKRQPNQMWTSTCDKMWQI